MKFLRIAMAIAFADSSVNAAILRGRIPTPDLTSYDPNDLLCKRGDRRILDWCKDWLTCIKSSAAGQGTPEAVLDAWSPAECHTMCDALPLSMISILGKRNRNETSTSYAGPTPECLESCENFKTSLSGCVAKILFEPGQIATMMPDVPAEGAEICTIPDTPCLPDLPIQHQHCVADGAAARAIGNALTSEREAECSQFEANMEECKDCPQVAGMYDSEYFTFVGGCMDQLNAYHAATHPQAQGAALPGAVGCTVH